MTGLRKRLNELTPFPAAEEKQIEAGRACTHDSHGM